MEIVNQAKMRPKDQEKYDNRTINIPKSAKGIQRAKISKLMSNPEKPVHIPDRPKEWKPKNAPEFVRDVMGSSAGAGSGEFHVYRHIRRREYNRQEYMDQKDKKEKMDEAFELRQKELNDPIIAKTAKKRAKRQRLKENKKRKAEEKKEEAASGGKKKISRKTTSDDENDDDEEEVAGPAIVIKQAKI